MDNPNNPHESDRSADQGAPQKPQPQDVQPTPPNQALLDSLAEFDRKFREGIEVLTRFRETLATEVEHLRENKPVSETEDRLNRELADVEEKLAKCNLMFVKKFELEKSQGQADAPEADDSQHVPEVAEAPEQIHRDIDKTEPDANPNNGEQAALGLQENNRASSRHDQILPRQSSETVPRGDVDLKILKMARYINKHQKKCFDLAERYLTFGRLLRKWMVDWKKAKAAGDEYEMLKYEEQVDCVVNKLLRVTSFDKDNTEEPVVRVIMHTPQNKHFLNYVIGKQKAFEEAAENLRLDAIDIGTLIKQFEESICNGSPLKQAKNMAHTIINHSVSEILELLQVPFDRSETQFDNESVIQPPLIPTVLEDSWYEEEFQLDSCDEEPTMEWEPIINNKKTVPQLLANCGKNCRLTKKNSSIH